MARRKRRKGVTEDEYWRTVGYYEGEGYSPRRAENAAMREFRGRRFIPSRKRRARRRKLYRARGVRPYRHNLR